MKHLSRNKGFTLIELLVVIAIIALLPSVVLASVNVAREKGRMGGALHADSKVQHVAGDNIVGQWEFDECSGSVAKDASGGSHDGTLVNNPVWSTDTPNGNGCSLLFNKTNYVELGNSSDFDMTNQVTISAWYKTTSAANQIIIGKDHTTSYYINTGGTYLAFWTKNNNTTIQTRTSDGRWHHVIVVYDNGNKSIYIDGGLRGTVSGSALNIDIKNLRIANSGNSQDMFIGNIDSVKLYKKSLSASEVYNLYAVDIKGDRFAQK